jgi:hypothetical protein
VFDKVLESHAPELDSFDWRREALTFEEDHAKDIIPIAQPLRDLVHSLDRAFIFFGLGKIPRSAGGRKLRYNVSRTMVCQYVLIYWELMLWGAKK